MTESDLGARTGGVWSAACARRAGLTLRQVRWRVESGHWQVLHRGVYALAGVVPDARMRGWAAVLASGGPGRAVVAGLSAARLLGLPLVDDADPLLPEERRTARVDDVVGDRPHRGGGLLRVSRVEVARQDRCLADGVPCLTPLRTLVDLARLLPHEALVCAVDDALRRRLVTEQDLAAVVLARKGLPHSTPFAAAVAAADGRAESPLETLSRLLLLPVLPGLVPQVSVCDSWGRVVARLDLGDERLRFGVEADGARWHRGEAALAADRRRDGRVQPYGWHLERVTWFDVRRDAAATRARVLRAAQRRAA